MIRFGVTTDCDRSSVRREYVNVYSGSFLSTFEADGYANHGAQTYSLTTYNSDKVAVRLPEGVTAPRNDANSREIDKAISDALNAHFAPPKSYTLAQTSQTGRTGPTTARD